MFDKFERNISIVLYQLVVIFCHISTFSFQMDASDKVQDQSATTELIKQLYNFISTYQ